MTSPNPAHSRAALNALRGLVFTTSCSVILLAEERRRRTKVARAAIDNARKLHTVKARHRPLAMWDSCFSEADLELLTTRPTTDAPRRRKRRSSPGQNTSSSQNGAEPQSSSANTASREHAVLPTDPVPGSPHPSHRRSSTSHKKPYGPNDPSTSHRPLLDIHLPGILASPLEKPLREPSLCGQRPESKEKTEDAATGATSKVLNAIMSENPNHLDHVSLGALHLLQIPPHYDAQGHPRFFYVFPYLRPLLEKLESSDVDPAMATIYQDLGLEIFKKIISQKPQMRGSLVTRNLRLHCRRFLKVIAQLNPSTLGAALDVVMPLYHDVAQLSVSLLHSLAETDNREAIRHFLRYLSELPPSTFKLDCSSVLRLLEGHGEVFTNPPATQQLYQALRNAGLSEFLELSADTKYKLHRSLVLIAYKHGNVAMCLEELGELHEINATRTNNDPCLWGPLIIAEAATSSGPSLELSLLRIEELVTPGSKEMHDILRSLADVWAQRLPGDVFEEAIESLVRKFRLPLKRRWMYTILGRHSANLDHEAMSSWLEFAFENGFRLDDKFLQKLYLMFRLRWRISDEELNRFYEALRELDPRVPPPDIIPKTSTKQARVSRRLNASQKLEGWEAREIRSAERLHSGEHGGDSKVFKFMQAYAYDGNWEEVWALYEKDCSSRLASSLRCLRLAVMARLNLDNGATRRTRKLIDESHERGLNVSEVLTPLLMAQIAEGTDPRKLVRHNLRRGFKIQTMVYNMASQSCCTAKHSLAAIEICEMAAAENGGGDLLYDPYNFASLVYSFTGLGHYHRLASVLSEFMEQKRWWAGSKVSMESMQLAMKTVAKRLTFPRSKRDTRLQQEALAKLDVAYEHGIQCKQTSIQRETMMDSFTEICRHSMRYTGKASAPKSAPVRYMTVKPNQGAPKGNHLDADRETSDLQPRKSEAMAMS